MLGNYVAEDSIQIINENQEFNKNILKYVKLKLHNADIGLNYHIVSVFGSQSTGKSTLLNFLFDTSFDVMNESRRQQTTKGIWLAYANNVATRKFDKKEDEESLPQIVKGGNPKNIIVMDVEGTDGRERGEDQDFERKAALFALSSSEILIINIWEHQVGLYHGANMALLKTVFEVNLSLFGKDKPKKVLLLFVIRDFLGGTPLKSLGNVLTEDLTKIWLSLNKPKELEGSKLSDFFDLEFFALPHKVLKTEEFTQDVKQLGDNFDTYLKPEYHKEVPFDGWTIYADNIWQQVINNKELDLPTQQILVAKFRCDEIINESYTDIFVSKLDKLRSSDFDNQDSKLDGVLKDIIEETLQKYDSLASRYTKSIYNEKRHELISKMNDKLDIIYKKYLKFLKEKSIKFFEDSFNEISSSKTDKNFNFIVLVEELKESTLNMFSDLLVTPIDGFDFNSSEELKELNLEIKKLVEFLKQKQLKSIKSKFEKSFSPNNKNKLKERLIYLISNKHDDKLWEKVHNSFTDKLKSSLDVYKQAETDECDFQLGLSAEENISIVSYLTKVAWKSYNEIIKNYLTEETAIKITRDYFENQFRYNKDGLPNIWKNSIEIDLYYKKAREAALKLIPLLSIIQIDNVEVYPPEFSSKRCDLYKDEEDDEDDKDWTSEFPHIFSDISQNSIQTKLQRQIDVIYVDAKRSIIQTNTSIPYWIYIVIMILGWNEFMAVFRNPVYFTFLLVIALSLYFIHSMGLWGPVSLIVNNTLNETLKVGKSKLKLLLDDEKTSGPSLS